MSSELLGWQDEHLLDHRRRLRTAMFVSLALHGLLLAVFAVSPPTPMAKAPEYIAVELIAAPSAGGRGPSKPPAAAKPAPAEPPPAAETPPPSPPPAPAPPAPKAPVQVLPEETPGRIREVKPEPEVVAKVEPKPAAKPAPKPPPRPVERPRRRAEKEEALSFEDAMAALEDELGGDETRDLLKPQAGNGSAESTDTEAGSTARAGVTVSPEQLAWDREVSRMIRARFPSLGQFRGRGLAARIEVVVSATGDLAGEPRLLGSSGDLDFDRIAIAVVERAAPLPPPPAPGARQLNLTSEER